jgi:hypothetical protein
MSDDYTTMAIACSCIDARDQPKKFVSADKKKE